MSRSPRSLPSLSLLAVALCAPGAALAAAGSPDASFGSAGRIRVMHDHAYVMTGLALQPDGRIVLSAQHGVGRFNADGSVDTSFAGDGYVDSVFGVPDSSVYQTVVQPDGRIVAAGSILAFPDATMALARFLPDGSRDLAFGDGGIVRIPGGALLDEALAIALQQDGRIVVAGYSDVEGGYQHVVVLRFLADGTPDPSFNGTGRVQVLASSEGAGAKAVAVQPDGRIVVSVGGYGRFAGQATLGAVLRFTADGQLDPAFASGGIAPLPLNLARGWSGASVVVQPDGRILASGITDDGLGVARLNADGSLDSSFGATGIAAMPVPGNSFPMSARGLQLQPDGRILALAETYPVASLMRLLPDGKPDLSFGQGGSMLIPLPDWGIQIFGNGMALQPDARFLTTGTIMVSPEAGGGAAHESVWRFLARDTDNNGVAEPWDLAPAAFQFAALAPVNGVVVTAPLTVSGLGAGIRVPVTVTGGEFAVNGGEWGTRFAYAGNGDTVALRYSANATPVLTVGGMLAPNNNAVVLGERVSGGVVGDVAPPAPVEELALRNVVPRPEALNVPPQAAVMAVFARPLQEGTIDADTFTLQCNGQPVAAGVILESSRTVARLRPQASLPLGAICTATLSAAVRGEGGEALPADYSWRFMTRPAARASAGRRR